MYKVSFMNGRQLIKSMLYRIKNDIAWREIMFFAVDTTFGSVRSWTLNELATLVEESEGTLDEFLKRYAFVELGFVFVR